MTWLSAAELAAMAAMLGPIAYFTHSLATRAWMSIAAGVVVSSWLLGVCTGAILHAFAHPEQWRVVIETALFLVLPVAACGVGGMLLQYHRRSVNNFGYCWDDRRWMGFVRWLVRARNLLISVLAVYLLGMFAMRDGISPVWMLALWLLVGMFVASNSDGFGIRANVIITNALPATARRLRRLNLVLVVAATVLFVTTVRLPVLSEEPEAYRQLAVFSLWGAANAWLYARIYRSGADEAEEEGMRAALMQANRIAVEVAWGLAVIGGSFLPTAFGWTWPSAFLVVVIVSLGAAVFRITHDQSDQRTRRQTS